MAKKKAPGRPRNASKRILKSLNYSEATIDVLRRLADRYRGEAPPYVQISDRAIIEALIHYAEREELSFSTLFGVSVEAQ